MVCLKHVLNVVGMPEKNCALWSGSELDHITVLIDRTLKIAERIATKPRDVAPEPVTSGAGWSGSTLLD